MNRVAAALAPGRIRLNLPVINKHQLLEAASLLFASYEGWEPAYIRERLAAREALGSTGLGHGVAIPHARLKGLHQAVAAFIRPSLAIGFDAPDGKPVTEVLVLLVPEDASEEHLQMLAQAAQMFGERRFRDELRSQTDADGVFQVFARWATSESAQY